MSARSNQRVEAAFVSVLDAAAMCGCSRSHVYRMLGAGSLRAVKAGTRTLIPVAAVERYLASLPPAEFGSNPRIGGARA